MVRALGFVVSVGIACSTSIAAASPAARLVYGRGAGAEKCPDEATLRKELAARVGYDPFFPYASRAIVLTIFGRDEGLAARIDLVDGERAAASRELVTQRTDCDELFQSAALAIAIAIDPRALVKPAMASPQEDSPKRPPPVAEEILAPVDSSAKDAPSEPRVRTSSSELQTNVRIAAGTQVSTGLQPGVAAGASVGFGAVWRRVSVGAELAAYLPTTTTSSSSANASVWVANTSLVPCLRFEPVTACGVVMAGRLEASGEDLAGGRTEALAFYGAGAKTGLELPLLRSVRMHFDGQLLGNLARPTVKIGDERVWKAPAIAAVLGAAVSIEL